MRVLLPPGHPKASSLPRATLRDWQRSPSHETLVPHVHCLVKIKPFTSIKRCGVSFEGRKAAGAVAGDHTGEPPPQAIHRDTEGPTRGGRTEPRRSQTGRAAESWPQAPGCLSPLPLLLPSRGCKASSMSCRLPELPGSFQASGLWSADITFRLEIAGHCLPIPRYAPDLPPPWGGKHR